MPVLCIRRTNVSSWDFVAYVCFRPMFNPERLLHPCLTKSARVCVVQAECAANRCVYRFPTLAWWDGQLRKKGAFRCEPLPRYGFLPPTKAPVGVNRQLLGRVFVAGLNLWIDRQLGWIIHEVSSQKSK